MKVNHQTFCPLCSPISWMGSFALITKKKIMKCTFFRFRAIKKRGHNIRVEKIEIFQVFEMAAVTFDGNRAAGTCTRAVCLHTEPNIGHGSTLAFPKHEIHGHGAVCFRHTARTPRTRAYSLNTHNLLAATFDKLACSFDVESLLGTFAEKGDGLVSSVMVVVLYAKQELTSW